MLNRKLLEVLQRLTNPQKKRLRQFLESPYFNNGYNAGDVLRLYDLIVLYHANEEHPALSYEIVFRQFFPNRPFREKTKSPLDSLASELYRLVRHFMGQAEMEREQGDIYEFLAMARFYRKFALEDRFWQLMDSTRKTQQASPLRDASHYYDQYRIAEEELSFRGLYNTFEDDTNLNAAQENLDIFYSILKLEFACAMEYQKRQAQIDNIPPALLLEEVLHHANESGPFDVPANRIGRKIIGLLQNQPSEKPLEALQDMLTEYQPQISPEKFNNLQAYYRILWVKHYHQTGNEHSLQRNFEISCHHLEQGFFYVDGMIPIHTFRNLVTFGLALKKFDWVKGFLVNHPPERIAGTRFAAEIHSVNTAELRFALKNYESALDCLIYRSFENPIFSILSDLLLVKIYFETRNELLESRMKALEQKVRRSKMSQEIKNRYFNFLKKLHKVIRYGWQKRGSKHDQLMSEIKNTPEIVAREWLLEQLS